MADMGRFPFYGPQWRTVERIKCDGELASTGDRAFSERRYGLCRVCEISSRYVGRGVPICFLPSDVRSVSRMDLVAGSGIGPYEVAGPIGAGGMGQVYKARDTRLNRIVAIKVLAKTTTQPD